MSFDDLPLQHPPLNPSAVQYIAEVMRRSRIAQRTCEVSIDNCFGADYWQKLDVYGRCSGRRPVLLFLHGGAWTSGSKEWMGFMAPEFLASSTLFVAANYRLVPDVDLDAQIEDCIAALGWVFENIDKFGGDRDQIFVGGHSAGGYLAAMLALDGSALTAHGLPAALVKGCIPVSGIFDLRDSSGLSQQLLNHLRENVADKNVDWKRLSPLERIGPHPCPFFIAAADHDLQGIAAQSIQMTDALRAKGGVARCEIYEGFDHFTLNALSCDPGHPWLVAVGKWIAERRGQAMAALAQAQI